MSKREISKFRGVELHLWSLAGAVAASPPCISRSSTWAGRPTSVHINSARLICRFIPVYELLFFLLLHLYLKIRWGNKIIWQGGCIYQISWSIYVHALSACSIYMCTFSLKFCSHPVIKLWFNCTTKAVQTQNISIDSNCILYGYMALYFRLLKAIPETE